MAYIFQPDRYLLCKQVKKYSGYIKGRVLDVGAGEFSRYEEFFKCDEYIKMDVFEDKNVNVIGSAYNIPFDNNCFDGIVSTQVLEHLKYPEKALQEIYRVLKSGGVCLLTVPQFNELHSEPADYFRYTKYGLTEILERNNFEVIKHDQRGGYYTTIAQMKIRYLIDRFNLYDHKIFRKIANGAFKLYGGFMIWLDRIDKSKANRKHTIGWAFVAKKK